MAKVRPVNEWTCAATIKDPHARSLTQKFVSAVHSLFYRSIAPTRASIPSQHHLSSDDVVGSAFHVTARAAITFLQTIEIIDDRNHNNIISTAQYGGKHETVWGETLSKSEQHCIQRIKSGGR